MKKTIAFALSLIVLGAQAQAFELLPRSGVDRCQPFEAPLTKSDQAIIFKKSNRNLTMLIAVDHGQSEVLGALTDTQIATFRPQLRNWIGSGLTVTYVVVGVGSAAILGFAAGMTAFVPVAEQGAALKSFAYLGGAELALGAGLHMIDPLNPFVEFKRADTEKCLVKQVSRINPNGETVVIRMNNASDFRSTKHQLKDLIHDLR